MSEPRAELHVILGSHACRTGMLLLEHKGVPYRTVQLPTGLHPFAVRLHGFPGNLAHRKAGDGRNPLLGLLDRLGTVPALEMDGERVQTNRRIARFLDERVPDPPLFPADAQARQKVEEAETWGDDEFQMFARRLIVAAGLQGRAGLVNGGSDGRLGTLLWRSDRVRAIGVRVVARAFSVDKRAEDELRARLSAMLDRIDAWIEEGVLNGERLNAADYMIVSSLALILYRPDLQAQIGSRPAGALADRVLPDPARAAAGVTGYHQVSSST